jgi:hypothetical protein
MRTLKVVLVVLTAEAAQFAPAQNQSTTNALRAACSADAQRLGAGVQPGRGPHSRLPQGTQGLSVSPVYSGRQSGYESGQRCCT